MYMPRLSVIQNVVNLHAHMLINERSGGVRLNLKRLVVLLSFLIVGMSWVESPVFGVCGVKAPPFENPSSDCHITTLGHGLWSE